jgi:Ca2+-binding EF-hand superfamily protein
MKPLLFAGAFAVLACAAAPSHAQPAPTQRLLPDPESLIASADANKDGAVSRAEFVAERAKTFPRLDRNRDGFLSRDEFLAAAPAGMRRNFLAAQFGRFDANNDGKLSPAEFNAAPTPGFDRLDSNGDGSLSAAEMKNARARP